MKKQQLGYLAQIIYDAYVNEGHDEAYLEDKYSDLAGLDKFQSLLYLYSRDSLQLYFADKIGVSIDDLQTTIRVIGRC